MAENDTAQAVATERTRISTIMALSSKHRVPENIGQDLITRGVPLDQARASILDYLAAEGDRASVGHLFPNGGGHPSLDNPATRAKAMGDAIAAKLLNKPADGPAAEYRAMSLIDMARECLVAGGERDAYRLSADRVATLAFGSRNPYSNGAQAAITQTTSDFPKLMQAGIDAALIERYKAQESQLKRLTSARDVPDFKTHQGIQIGGFGSLNNVNEAGEFKNKPIPDLAKEKIRATTKGNIINLSRHSVSNVAFAS